MPSAQRVGKTIGVPTICRVYSARMRPGMGAIGLTTGAWAGQFLVPKPRHFHWPGPNCRHRPPNCCPLCQIGPTTGMGVSTFLFEMYACQSGGPTCRHGPQNCGPQSQLPRPVEHLLGDEPRSGLHRKPRTSLCRCPVAWPCVQAAHVVLHKGCVRQEYNARGIQNRRV